MEGFTSVFLRDFCVPDSITENGLEYALRDPGKYLNITSEYGLGTNDKYFVVLSQSGNISSVKKTNKGKTAQLCVAGSSYTAFLNTLNDLVNKQYE